MTRLLIIMFLFVGSVEVNAVEPLDGECFGNLGCFSTAPPFTSPQRPIAFLPQSPDTIKTRYILLTRDSIENPHFLDARYPGTALDVWTNFVARPTKFIIHGFLDIFEKRPWMQELAEALLKYGDYNVIVVDWSGGNQFPYTQATANTRVVGAQIAALINHLIVKGKLTAADFHIIGHSLGGHTAGYAGERIPGLGRISGLDPAGPYFRDTDKRVRLDVTDAVFVDVIHSDANGILGFGTSTLSGHVDFFPNSGHDQPGCQQGLGCYIEQNGFVQGIIDEISCSHVRSIQFYKESINSPCTFVGFPCSSELNFKNKQCETCGDVGCSRMGFHADKYKPRGQTATYYLSTGASDPFCRYHYKATVKFATGSWPSVSGTTAISVRGNLGKSSWVSLTGVKDAQVVDKAIFQPAMCVLVAVFALSTIWTFFALQESIFSTTSSEIRMATTLSPGQTYTFYVDLSEDVDVVNYVYFSWQTSLPLFLLDRLPNITVDRIEIQALEDDRGLQFCNEGQSVEAGASITLSNPC